MSDQIEKSKGPQQEPGQKDDKKKVRFWDTWQALVVFVILILLARYFAFEPYKIPSGSMEPTLIGHEQHGDRIATNKLAYKFGEPKRFDVVVFKYEKEWDDASASGSKNYIKRLVGLPGDKLIVSDGDLFLEGKDGKEEVIRKWECADDLQDILWQPVSRPDFDWKKIPEDATDKQDNFIKGHNRRAFPWNVEPENALGSKIRLSSGHLKVEGQATLTFQHRISNIYVKMGRWPFRHMGCPETRLPGRKGAFGIQVRDPREKTERIRPYLPDSWSGVQCPNCNQLRYPLSQDSQIEPRIVPTAGPTPFSVIVKNVSSVDDRIAIDVEVKEGCALIGDFIQIGNERVPLLALERSEQGELKDVDELKQEESGRVYTRMRDPNAIRTEEKLDWVVTPESQTPYFYGDGNTVGDLKLEMEFKLDASIGALDLEVGSNKNRAGWVISLGDPRPAPAPAEGRHEIEASPDIQGGMRHTLSLAYVDGTVIATLDGEIKERRPIEIQPMGFEDLQSVVKIRFLGEPNLEIFRLDVYRDLYYTLQLDHAASPWQRKPRQKNKVYYEENKRRLVAEIPEDFFMVMGDNSPSSSDSRVWGLVPRDHMIGRASFIWWPPSRWRTMR